MSPACAGRPSRTFPPVNTAGAVPSSAFSTTVRCGSTSYSTFTARAASIACSSVSAATAATSSPWNITRLFLASEKSRTRSAAFTPGIRVAADRSTATTRACGCGDRTMRAYSMPGRLMSNVYFARPVTLSGPSTRLTRVPRTDDLLGQANSELATLSPFHARNGLEDPRERTAPADVAVEAFFNLFGRRIRILLEQSYARHDEARRTESAHQRILITESLLNGMQLVGASETVHI